MLPQAVLSLHPSLEKLISCPPLLPLHLGNLRLADVSYYGGKLYVNIREYYEVNIKSPSPVSL